MKTAVLLSGGLDSTALTAIIRPDLAYTINYGQKCADAEIQASKIVCKRLGIPIKIINANCANLGSGDLAGTNPNFYAPSSEWWPYRNQLLGTLAAMDAISEGVNEILFGTVITDSIHQDGTLDFFQKFSALVNMQEGGLLINSPFILNTTAELIEKSKINFGILGWTHSCHTSNIACGQCRGCNKRVQVLREIGFLS